MDLKDTFRSIAAVFTHNRKAFLPSAVARVCQMYLTSYNNIDFNFDRNGEKLILERLAKFSPKSVFDVGANVGDWSVMASTVMPSATIHGFEIAPPTYEAFAQVVANNPRIEPHDFGLSSEDGEVEVAFFPDANTVTTTILENEVFSDGKELIQAPVRTGDGFCREAGIDHIDLLKIDVEGAEHFVLDGFKEMLSQGKVDVIQFEYGMVSLYSGFFLKDMYALLEPYGFAIGKLYRNGVAFKDYVAIEDEDLKGPNYIACRKDKATLLTALSA